MFASVLDDAATFAVSQASVEQRPLFETAFRSARLRLDARDLPVEALDSVRLPRLVHAAVTGDDAPVRPLAVALTVLYVGMDLWDSVIDDELDAAWAAYRSDQVSLAAAALIGGVAPLAIISLKVPARRLVLVQRALARAFIFVADGQQRDVAMRGRVDVTVEQSLAAVAGKSGAVAALFAETSALVAGASADAVAAYAELGHALGTATQIGSDLGDLFDPEKGADFAGGLCTVPIALHLDSLQKGDRAAFMMVLERARSEETARVAARRQLSAGGAVEACAMLIEAQRARARAALLRSGANEPSCREIRRLIDSLSFVRHALSDSGG